MVPPRAPSFFARHGRDRFWPPGRPSRPPADERTSSVTNDNHPLVAQPGRGARLRPGRFVVRIHAGGLMMRRRSTAGRPVVTRRMLVRAQPSQLSLRPARGRSQPCNDQLRGRLRARSFLGRLTAGSSALNRRMRGSNPARGASYGRDMASARSPKPLPEGSIPSVRALAPPGRARLPAGGSGLRRALAPLRIGGLPGLCYSTIPSGRRRRATRREREISCPGRLAARTPASQAGDAGSSPARGTSGDRGVSGSTWRCQRRGPGSTPGGRFRLSWPRPAPAGQSPAPPAARRAEVAPVGSPCSSTVPPPYATSA
jgi:hypothetical protein